jgi:excinuclease ABC subunit A
MKLIGASGNNLKNINVEFPLGVLCAVTGVSGAGKTSLVQNTLFGAVSKHFETDIAGTLHYEEIHGADWVSEVVLVDASPIGKSSRSNPVTYVKAFSEIRNCFADTLDASRQNFGPGKFSFNVAGGRCEKCRGDGQLSLNMQFMADLWVTCDQCNGTRYREDVLSVRYRDRNIAQVLAMTVREAFPFFRGHPQVQSKLKALIDVGLEYIQLGQSANTLSSGESQRLKMAHYLNTAKNRRVLFIMDQPTTGLHPHDIIRLLDCFNSLISVGHSMIVVEHNLSFIKHADWIIDLGPGAAEQGGLVVAAGTPEEVATNEESVTGSYLSALLPACQ